MDAEQKALRTAARYLGLRGGAPDAELDALLHRAWERMLSSAQPRHIIKEGPVLARNGLFTLDTLAPLPTRDLCRFFSGAARARCVLATLGTPLDTLIRRLMLTDPALGAAVGACGSAYIDLYLDTVVGDGPRFSPGYGDVPLSFQRPFLEWLEARRIGVTLTEGFLMQPEKSVSALQAMRG